MSGGVTDYLLPPGTDAVQGVFVDGVELVEGRDFTLLDDRVRLTTPIEPRRATSGFGKFLISLGIGVYDRGSVVDLALTRGGRPQVVRGRPAA